MGNQCCNEHGGEGQAQGDLKKSKLKVAKHTSAVTEGEHAPPADVALPVSEMNKLSPKAEQNQEANQKFVD